MANDIRPSSRWGEPRQSGAATSVGPAYWVESGGEVSASAAGPATHITVDDGDGNRLLRPIAPDYVLIQDPEGAPGDILVASSGTPIAHLVADPENPGGFLVEAISEGNNEVADLFDHAGAAIVASTTPTGQLRKVGTKFISQD